MPSMNPELKAKWLDALESGKFTQGQSRLRSDRADGETDYCCLGVLCEVSGKGQWKLSQHGHSWGYEVDGVVALLVPPPGLEPAMAEKIEATLFTTPQMTRVDDLLTTFNDTKRWTFKQIAQWVRENL